jgi:hypothetical protein
MILNISSLRCLSSCPEEYVDDWIGDLWQTYTDKSLQPSLEASSSSTKSAQSSLYTTCKPLPSSFQIAANYFTQHTYNIFQKGLADAQGEKAYRKLYE